MVGHHQTQETPEVEIPLNPYQGLKLIYQFSSPITELVEIPLNPYQGLKHSDRTREK